MPITLLTNINKFIAAKYHIDNGSVHFTGMD